jgi:hypothetical protein
MNSAPLRGVRSTIARVFADDGWKQASGISQTGTYELRKTSPGGRRLGLIFRVQSPRGSSRTIFSTMQLVSDGGTLNLRVHAERSMRHDYEVPDSQVLSQILDNMRVVVKHLEKTWMTELEEALGPRQRNSKRGNR